MANFYGQMIQLKHNTQNDAKSIQRNHEYVLCYTKDTKPLLLTYTNEVRKPVYEDQYVFGRDTGASSGHDLLTDRANLGYTIYYIESTANGATGNHNLLIDRANRFNEKYGHYDYFESNDGSIFRHCIAVPDYDKTKITPNATESDVYVDCQDLLDAGYIKIRPPKRKGGKLGRWTWGIDTFQQYWNANEVTIKNNKNVIKKNIIDSKDIVTDDNGRKWFVQTNRLPLQSIIDYDNASGTTALKGNSGVLPGCTFTNPKGVEFLKYLIGAYESKNAIILDFFAGSGTTAQAVEELNNDDGGHRQWIMITNNEDVDKNDSDPDTGICRDITKPRIDTVITGMRPDGSKYSAGTDSGAATVLKNNGKHSKSLCLTSFGYPLYC